MQTRPGEPRGRVATLRRWWAWRTTELSAPDPQFDRDDVLSAAGTTDVASQQGHADLLVRRMRALHLDPDQFAASEDSAFAELNRLCARCDSRGQCERELEDEFADPGWQAWRDYCPNSTMLRMLTALHGCEVVAASEQRAG